MTLAFTLFIAGMLTILLPCILPLIPIVLGVSVTGRSKWRPLLTIAGMLVSFVGFTFLLQVVLSSFIEAADYLRIVTYYALLLFGIGFLTHNRTIQIVGSLLGALLFIDKGMLAVAIAAVFGVIAMFLGGIVATKIQSLGSSVQQKTREGLGNESPLAAFIIGLTLGLVWVPCAGPALGFALTLVRDEPGIRAALYLLSYGLGTAVPLLLIGYGGQAAVHSVRRVTPYTGIIKQIAGVLLILTAIALHFRTFERIQIWLLDNTNFGDLGTRIEESLFGEDMEGSMFEDMDDVSTDNGLQTLPKITRAPELASDGPWHNSEPLTMADLRGKVVLVDFWTYSCINCIRTLPYIQGYWEKYQDTPFVLLGVHTPEFVFEKSQVNVADAIKRHGLTYPVVQDNEYGTWRAFANRYWPAKYLIDADGYIRYTHFGEGAYEETDKAIESLLSEIGVNVEESEEAEESKESNEVGRTPRSPETYLGERSWPALGNAQGDPDRGETVSYTAPGSMSLNRYYLVGQWMLDEEGERQILESDTGEIRMKWQGNEVNLVLGPPEDGKAVEADVMIDGAFVKTISIDRYDLYNLYTGEQGVHELVLNIKGKGVSGYAFTFGS